LTRLNLQRKTASTLVVTSGFDPGATAYITGVNVMPVTAVTVIFIWRSVNQVKIIFIDFSIIKVFCEGFYFQ
jgi:hypothetical protein